MPKKIAIIADRFELGSPAQQLLDRFVIGYARDGMFQPPAGSVVAWTPNANEPLLEKRPQVRRALSHSEALSSADAVLFFSSDKSAKSDSSDLSDLLRTVRPNTPVFVYGALATKRPAAASLVRLAAERQVPLCAGSAASVLLELPPLNLPPNRRIIDALIVVPADLPAAELTAADGLFAILARAGTTFPEDWKVHVVLGDTVWKTPNHRWSWSLLEAALSRSDKVQGNTLRDGRTENIFGQGLVPAMAKTPRLFVFEPELKKDKYRAAFFLAKGLIGDVVAAVQVEGGTFSKPTIHSTQLFHAPAPQHEHFNRLTAVINDFFASGKTPWPADQSLATATMMGFLK